jgi:hypothetical protein
MSARFSKMRATPRLIKIIVLLLVVTLFIRVSLFRNSRIIPTQGNFVRSGIPEVDYIFVIGDYSAKGKYHNTLRILQKTTGLNFNYIQQQGPKSPDTLSIRDNKGWAENVDQGVLACLASHYKLWKYVASLNSTSVLILEEDIDMTRNFRLKLNWIYQHLGQKWSDLFMLGYCYTGCIAPGIQNAGSFLCTHAYIITPQAARTFLNALYIQKEFIGVDFLMNKCAQIGNTYRDVPDNEIKYPAVKAKLISPPLVRQFPRGYKAWGLTKHQQLWPAIFDDPIILPDEKFIKYYPKGTQFTCHF